MTKMTVNSQAVLLIRNDDMVYAFPDRCTHQDIPLSSFGRLDPTSRLTCLAHGACFQIENGRRVSGPECPDLRLLPVKVQKGVVSLALS